MGGLDNRSSEQNTYINVVGGKFAKKVKAETEGAVSRVNKKNETVHELQYNTLADVNLVAINKKDGDYGFQWEVTLKYMDETFILNLPYSGRQTNGIFFRLPNIAINEPMTLKCHMFTDDAGISKTFVTVEQNGKKIDPAYSKDNPNGLPPLEPIKVKGKDSWDDTKQMEFIERMIEIVIQPQLKAQSEFVPDNIDAVEHPEGYDPELGF